MELCVDSILTPGEAAPAVSSPDLNKDILPDEDHFQCTFFRQPKQKSMLLNESPTTPFNSSDSEVEFEESTNPRSSDESSINSATLYTYDDEDFQQDKKTLDSPKVTFGRTLYMGSDNSTKLHAGKESTKLNDIPKNPVQVTKDRKNSTKINNLKNKNYDEKGKMLLVKCMNNDRYAHAFSDARYIFYGTKRSYDLGNNGSAVASKRRRFYENRIVKNKRLLKSVENVIHTLSEQESIKPRNKVAETNLVKTVSPEQRCESQETVVDDSQTDEFEMRRPIFKRPELEKFLNESMHRAVRMYRTCRNTWDGIDNEKLGISKDFQANNPISWFSVQNSFTT